MKRNDNVTHPAAETATPDPDGRSAEREGLLFGALGVLVFSLSMVGTRAAAPELGGVFVGLGRGLLAAIPAAIVLRVGRVPFPPRWAWSGLFTVIVGSVIGFPLLSAVALAHVPASHGLIFTALMPACTALAAVVRTGEATTPRFWAGSLGGLALVLAYALDQGAGGPQSSDGLLALGMVMSAIAYAEGGRLSARIGGVAVLSWSLVLAVPILLPAVILVYVTHAPSGSAAAWIGFGYVSLFSMYLGFLAWYRGMAKAGVARTSQLQTVQPLLGLGWSALLLGEPLSLKLGLTALGVIACVAFGRSAPEARRRIRAAT